MVNSRSADVRIASFVHFRHPLSEISAHARGMALRRGLGRPATSLPEINAAPPAATTEALAALFHHPLQGNTSCQIPALSAFPRSMTWRNAGPFHRAPSAAWSRTATCVAFASASCCVSIRLLSSGSNYGAELTSHESVLATKVLIILAWPTL